MSGARVPVRDDLAGISPYGAPQLDVEVRLNTNEPPYPPPPAFFERFTDHLRSTELNRYPDRGAWSLRAALGARFSVPPERMWAANGSNEVLLHVFQAYGGPRRRLLLFRPGYSAHPFIARAAATPFVEADLDGDFTLSQADARSAIADHDPDIVCISRPNAPTGVMVDLDVVRILHDAGRALVVLDEAYVEFAGSDAISLLTDLPRLVITRTFSKAWRLAGLRLGYLIGPDWVVQDIERVRLPYHLDMLTQCAGLAALELADDMTAHIPDIVAERERLRELLAGWPRLEILPSGGNFLMLRTDVADLFERLLDKGVLVRDFSDSPGLAGTALRVTIGTRDENDRFVSALKESMP